MLSTGIDIINIGIVPTPVNYFSLYHLDVSGAVQITGVIILQSLMDLSYPCIKNLYMETNSEN